MLKEDIAKTRSRTAELQVQANEETEHKQKTEEEVTRLEACLRELQNSLAESNKTHEEFILEVTKEKCEMDEELKNAQLELQNSIVGHDCMAQVRNQVCFLWQYTWELCSRNVFFYCTELADHIVEMPVANIVVLNGRMIDEYVIVGDVGRTVLKLTDILYCEFLWKSTNYISGWTVLWLRLERGSESWFVTLFSIFKFSDL